MGWRATISDNWGSLATHGWPCPNGLSRMASTPNPQPDHPLLRGLDKVFTGPGGNAPALVGWLSYLAHPEEHEGPRLIGMQEGSGEVTREFRAKPEQVIVPKEGDYYAERGSILRDLEGRSFFAHADVLSGHRLGEQNSVGEPEGDIVGDVYRLIEEVRFKRPNSGQRDANSCDVWDTIAASCDSLFNSPNGWSGDAAKAAQQRYNDLVLWYDNYRDGALAKMMGS